jgi:hypothetical protein
MLFALLLFSLLCFSFPSLCFVASHESYVYMVIFSKYIAPAYCALFQDDVS